MEYTDQQRAAFKDAYAKRQRKKIIVIVLLAVAMSSLAINEKSAFFGLSMAVLGPISFVAIVVGWVIFEDRNWRCPACDEYLGRAFNPKKCRGCGIELRG